MAVLAELIDITLDKDNAHNDNIPIIDETFSIGRDLKCSHVLLGVGISRHHCLIERKDGKWLLLDTSLNGTMVNNSLVTKDTTRELSDGDKINFGIKQYMFRIKPESQLLDGMDEKELNAVVDQVESVQVQGAENVVGEEDLSCSVCTELFYDAVTLGCSHTFCKHCIVQWKQRNNVCPMCRVIIKTETPTILINNLVEKYLLTASDEIKAHRKAIVDERKNAPAAATDNQNRDQSYNTTIDSSDAILIDDDEDDPDWSDLSFSENASEAYENDHYTDEDLVSLEGDDDYSHGYYGGYGNCFSCGEPGHWANSCPNVRSWRRY